MAKSYLKLYCILLAVLCMSLGGCFVEDDPYKGLETAPPYGDGTYSNPALTGVGRGQYGSKVITVTLKIVNGVIKGIDVDHDETPGYGKNLIDKVKPLIVRANSFEIDAITTSTLSYTKNALLQAGRNALSQIPNQE